MNAYLVLLIIYCVLSILLLGVLLFLFFWVIRKSSRNSIWKKDVFSGDPIATLLGLGVAALTKINVIPALVSATIYIFYTLILIIPLDLIKSLSGEFGSCNIPIYELNNDRECINEFILAFGQVWSSGASNLYNRVIKLPYTDMVVFLIAWTLGAYFFRYIRKGTRRQPNWLRWITNIQSYLNSPKGKTFVSNSIFVLVIGIGGYLSLAAIAAIPVLQTQTQSQSFEEVSVDNLSQQLDLELNQFQERLPEKTSSDPLQSIKQWMSEEQSRIDETASLNEEENNETVALLTKRLTEVEKRVESYEKSYLDIFSSWQAMRKKAITEIDKAKEDAITTYTVKNLNRIGNYENFEHFLAIRSWYSGNVTSITNAVTNCYTELNNIESYLSSWSGSLVAELSVSDEQSASSLNVFSIPPGFGFESCDNNNISIRTPVPTRQALGESFPGPFGVVSRWLLATESLSLALITGMLGFGLIGAASSTVIREQKEQGKTEGPLVSNITSVVIRGLSAAIVIFLAVEGGLAVFTFGDSDPNPYVLLFTCLVGAVYSEVIWKRARDYLVKQMSDDENSDVVDNIDISSTDSD